MASVFIDGSNGTTGLQIKDRLLSRDDIKLISVPEEKRHDPDAKFHAMKQADITILCLPDEAAKEDALLAAECDTVVIDTSTAHRTEDGWTYGMPEIYTDKKIIKESRRVANPGCHASGYILLMHPLVENGIISEDARLSCTSLTGYSGGGKKMIAEYESDGRNKDLSSTGLYALGQNHKHLPEMVKYSGIKTAPVFCPVVCDFYSGMQTLITLDAEDVCGGAEAIKEVYKNVYNGKIVKYKENVGGFIYSSALSGRDDMTVLVLGNEERIVLTALYDNLGKGASGSAVQNLNIITGAEETKGLILE